MSKRVIEFETLNEAINCYGRANLIPIDNIKQCIFYTKHGCQPRFVWEKEGDPGKMTCWFLKAETGFVYQKWLESYPKKNDAKRRQEV